MPELQDPFDDDDFAQARELLREAIKAGDDGQPKADAPQTKIGNQATTIIIKDQTQNF